MKKSLLIVKSTLLVNFLLIFILESIYNLTMKKLKDLRIENNLNIKEMAKLVGISPTYYWQIENKSRRLYYELAVKISKIFNLKPDDIFYEEF